MPNELIHYEFDLTPEESHMLFEILRDGITDLILTKTELNQSDLTEAYIKSIDGHIEFLKSIINKMIPKQ